MLYSDPAIWVMEQETRFIGPSNFFPSSLVQFWCSWAHSNPVFWFFSDSIGTLDDILQFKPIYFKVCHVLPSNMLCDAPELYWVAFCHVVALLLMTHARCIYVFHSPAFSSQNYPYCLKFWVQLSLCKQLRYCWMVLWYHVYITLLCPSCNGIRLLFS